MILFFIFGHGNVSISKVIVKTHEIKGRVRLSVVSSQLSSQNIPIPNWPEMIIEKIFSLFFGSCQLVRAMICMCARECVYLLLIMECIHFTYRIIFIMPHNSSTVFAAEQQQLYPVVTWDTRCLPFTRFRSFLLFHAYFALVVWKLWVKTLSQARFGPEKKNTLNLREVCHEISACKVVFQTDRYFLDFNIAYQIVGID